MPTLADLRTRLFNRLDIGNTGYIPVSEANTLINEGAAHLHNWLVTEAEYLLFKELSVPLVSGQSDYTLPADFLKMLKVFGPSFLPQVANTPSLAPLTRLMPEEYRGLNVGMFQSPFPIRVQYYMIMGNIVRIMPVPTNLSGSLVFWYAPQYTNLVADTDALNLVVAPGWEEFIINQAVIGARLKEESDVSDLVARQQQIMALMQSAIINRDMGRHQHVVDVQPGSTYRVW